ncbi:CvpA family protein [Helicobacter sp. 13S00477-4]|uniref:CvpA family protein n=1 Tax=Helicobacter sp. 13S00477-4 TaxID=1905759 RepID=UPI000BA595B3|nr:CvpA family protein [Helicobacter sp. 13S00477-4]PAF52031.1 hypothetical protein BKH44_03935 [Helicobacter sp. 13S00477-4]
MGYIDLILIIIIIVIGLRGFYNGFVNELAGVLGIVLGVFFASRFAGNMGDWFNAHVYNFNSHSVSMLIGFVVILAVIWVAFLILGIIIARFVKITDFAIIDKTLGFIFSCCKIFLIIGFILYGISKPEFMKSFNMYMEQNSKIYSMMDAISSSIMKIQSVQKAINNAKNITDPAVDEATKKLEEKIQQSTQETSNNVQKTIQESVKNIPSNIVGPAKE